MWRPLPVDRVYTLRPSTEVSRGCSGRSNQCTWRWRWNFLVPFSAAIPVASHHEIGNTRPNPRRWNTCVDVSRAHQKALKGLQYSIRWPLPSRASVKGRPRRCGDVQKVSPRLAVETQSLSYCTVQRTTLTSVSPCACGGTPSAEQRSRSS